MDGLPPDGRRAQGACRDGGKSAMSEITIMPADKMQLPLIYSDAPKLPDWHGWMPVEPLSDSPEPLAPQGEYGETPVEWLHAPLVDATPSQPVELLAPAGG